MMILKCFVYDTGVFFLFLYQSMSMCVIENNEEYCYYDCNKVKFYRIVLVVSHKFKEC